MTTTKKIIENADNAYSKTEYDKAVELYKQVLALNPKNKHAQQYLRKTEELKKLIENADDAYYAAEYDKAIQLYKQILDLDPDNKHAQDQVRKAERNRLSKSATPETVPIEALQLYKRSRSFIAAGDLIMARKLLKQAIDVAEGSGVNFTSAQDLLGNIKNALKAEAFKARANNEIDVQQWLRAVDDLNSAFNLDPTDDVTGTLLLHLRSLLKAHRLINSLNVGAVNRRSRSAAIKEIREIINLTNETTVLSKLWQGVVNLFGERDKNIIFRLSALILTFTSVIKISALS
jgi:tetratricopeptide (TPR) repeat protein